MASEFLDRSFSRREFTAASITALFVGMVVTVTGCGGGRSAYSPAAPSAAPAPTPTSSGSGDKTGAISGNHGHSAIVTSAQLLASGAVSLGIRGSADHDHTLELTSDQVRAVAAGTKVSKTSGTATVSNDPYAGSAGSHDHSVTFN